MILLFGGWTVREVTALFVGCGVFFIALASSWLWIAQGHSGLDYSVPWAIALLVIGVLVVVLGVVWFRRAPTRNETLKSEFS